MKLLTILLLSFTTFSGFSQSFYQTSYGDAEVDRGIASVATSTGGFCILSRNGNVQLGQQDIVLYNIGNDGSLFWSAKIGTTTNDYPTDLKQTSDGGFIICGYTYGGFIDSLTTDVFLLKVDDQGFPMWSNTYGGSANDAAYSVLVNDVGEYYIFGNTSSYGNAATSALAMRFDASGNPLWTNVNSSNATNSYSCATFNQSKQILAAGYSLNTQFNIDQYISLIDTNGITLWSFTTGSNNPDMIFAIYQCNDGGFVTAGSSSNLSSGNYDVNIVKRDANGTILWNKNFGKAEEDQAFSIVEDSLQNLYVTGRTNIGSSASVVYQNFILQLDHQGNLLFSKSYGDPALPSEGNNIIIAGDGNIVSTGYINSFGDPNGDTYFVKTEPNGNSGCYQLPLSFISSTNFFTDSSGVDQQLINPLAYQTPMIWQSFSNQFSRFCFNNSIDLLNTFQPTLFPNPGTGIFQLSINDINEHVLTITNTLGQKVIEKKFGEMVVHFDLSHCADGIYFYQIDHQFAGKFIKTTIH